MYNDDSYAVAPRDLVYDPMKGGDDPKSMFYRIKLGMPGTPHPATPAVPDQTIIHLVHFCQSLGKEPKRLLAGSEQAARANRHALTADFQ